MKCVDLTWDTNTTTGRAQYRRQTRSFRRSGAATKRFSRTRMALTTYTSLRWLRKVQRATGSRRYPGKAGTQSSAITRLGLIRPGGLARLNWSSMPAVRSPAPVGETSTFRSATRSSKARSFASEYVADGAANEQDKVGIELAFKRTPCAI